VSTYVVTGGAGFIGHHVVAELLGAGHRVRVLDDISTGSVLRLNQISRWKRSRLSLTRGCVTDRPLLEKLIEGSQGVVHLAALSSLAACAEDEERTGKVNVDAVRDLCEVCGPFGARLVSASSVAARNPKLSAYAESKLAGENVVRWWAAHGLTAVALRFLNVYGPGQLPDSPYSAVVPRFLAATLQDEPCTIYGDGGQSRDFVFVRDVVQAILAVLVHPMLDGRQSVDIGTGESVTIARLHALCGEAVGRKVRRPRARSARPGELREASAETEQAEAVLNWRAQTSLARGLKMTGDWMHFHLRDPEWVGGAE